MLALTRGQTLIYVCACVCKYLQIASVLSTCRSMQKTNQVSEFGEFCGFPESVPFPGGETPSAGGEHPWAEALRWTCCRRSAGRHLPATARAFGVAPVTPNTVLRGLGTVTRGAAHRPQLASSKASGCHVGRWTPVPAVRDGRLHLCVCGHHHSAPQTHHHHQACVCLQARYACACELVLKSIHFEFYYSTQ